MCKHSESEGVESIRSMMGEKAPQGLGGEILWVLLCAFLNSLMTQTVKDLPAMQETWVRSVVWEDPLEKEMATHSSILA